MTGHRVFVIPEANIGGEKKTAIMRSQFGAYLALGMSPDVDEAYEVDSNGKTKTQEQLYRAVSRFIKGTPQDLETTLDRFCEITGMSATRLIIDRAASA